MKEIINIDNIVGELNPEKTWFTSDYHLGHQNILHLGKGRPFSSLEEQAGFYRADWCSKVDYDHTVFLLGDIAMGNMFETILFFKTLPGRILFIPGNHDAVFSKKSKNVINRTLPVYEGVGFEVLPEIVSLTFGGYSILASHFPRYLGGYDGKFVNFSPPVESYPTPLLFGHTHSAEKFPPEDDRAYHVGVDANEYKLVSGVAILEWLRGLQG